MRGQTETLGSFLAIAAQEDRRAKLMIFRFPLLTTVNARSPQGGAFWRADLTAKARAESQLTYALIYTSRVAPGVTIGVFILL
jgi:hypothetical protein